MPDQKIKVKVLSRLNETEWRRYFPDREAEWGACRFLFAPDERQYDWLVVYNDLPPAGDERFSINRETLACPQNNTLLVTHEPSSIRIYGNDFTGQFGHVLTSQEEWALPHKNRIYSQPALHWYYGREPENLRGWRRMHGAMPAKSRQIAAVCARKQHMTRTQIARDRFVNKLKSRLPELEIYGRGVRPVADKSEAIDDYYYHLAAENHIGLHHWTEKLADPFLGLALPFYAGCPNAADYFPEESFVPVDIHRDDDAIEIILKVIHDNEYSRRLPAIMEARRRVLEEYNFFAVVSAIIVERHEPGNAANTSIRSRRAVLSGSPLAAIRYLTFKLHTRIKNY